MSGPSEWMDNPAWWVYGCHTSMAGAFARFHSRNRFHLRMAMSQTPEVEDSAYWEAELARREAAMQAGQAVHLVGFPKTASAPPETLEIGGLVSFWSIEHGDFQGCTFSILLDRFLEGRGMMHAMAEPAIREVIERHKLHRVMATHLPENLRSARLLRRLLRRRGSALTRARKRRARRRPRRAGRRAPRTPSAHPWPPWCTTTC
jgi:ribosomal-protein-alanine N-acetyltransferase